MKYGMWNMACRDAIYRVFWRCDFTDYYFADVINVFMSL